MLRVLAAVVIVTASGLPVARAESDISFAAGTDYRSLKTFAIREGSIVSDKLEINNRLFRQRLESSIRAALLKKGLKETPDKPDVWVTYSVRDKDVRGVERLGPTRMSGGPGGPDMVIRAPPANPVLYTEGVLVIDISNASNALLWRGTEQDRAKSAPLLSKQLSEDARKLLTKYPPGRK
jgi:hypothetical protein